MSRSSQIWASSEKHGERVTLSNPSSHLAVEDSDSNNDLVVLLVVGVDEEGNTGIILCSCRQRTILENKLPLTTNNIHLQVRASPSTSRHQLNCFSTKVEKYQNQSHFLLKIKYIVLRNSYHTFLLNKKQILETFCKTHIPPSS